MEITPSPLPFPRLNLLSAAGKTDRATWLRALPVRTVIFSAVALLSWLAAIVSVGVLVGWIKLPTWV